MMCKYIVRMLSLAVISGLIFCRQGDASEAKYELWDSSGFHKVGWHLMDVSQKTFALERYKSEITYCIRHMGEKFNEVKIEKVGSTKGFRIFTDAITYGLVAMKYQDDYINPRLAAYYYYKDWRKFRECEDERSRGRRKEGCLTFGVGPGDYSPLAYAVAQWKTAELYDEALSHYQEYFEDRFLRLLYGKRQDKLLFLKRELTVNVDLKNYYDEFMNEWELVKILAKTAKPKPLDPAVQHHEWFYSDKQEEVLKALEYYHKFNVRFMLEKALKHKDPAVAAKAKEYLESLAKDKGFGDEKKR